MWRILTRLGSVLVLVPAILVVSLHPGGIQAASVPLKVEVQMVAHLAGCVDRNPVMRGDQVIWLIKVFDPGGQEITAGLDVTVRAGTLQVKAIGYVPQTKFWAVPLSIVWDMPTGSLPWYVTVRDPQGNVVEWRPPSFMVNRVLTIIPGPLKVGAQVVDPVSGNPVAEARPGTVLRITASVSRPVRGDLYPYGKPDRELTGVGLTETKGAPLTQDVTVRAIVGQGAFVQGTQTFSGGVLATVPVTYDLAREIWRASFAIPAGAAPGAYTVAVVAKDKYDNTGVGLSAAITLRR